MRNLPQSRILNSLEISAFSCNPISGHYAFQVPWQAPELPLDEERILVLDGDPLPPDEFLGS